MINTSMQLKERQRLPVHVQKRDQAWGQLQTPPYGLPRFNNNKDCGYADMSNPCASQLSSILPLATVIQQKVTQKNNTCSNTRA